ncbi:putative alpha/beta hydrolase [Mycolicibacterium palauense]|uniref:putative alpha/beta hydrolase n=1 Tax=Mycolicibacterium palauense TaxID=2034511 RepID=UPI000BFEC8CD|nr:hypothetical protein [Mycolicibacterium palauense]
MPEYPNLTHIGVGELIAAAGDPWVVDETLQSGDPGEINELARAFYNAGACTSETYTEFVNAQQRFQASWNREDGEYPINDSAEVQRATTKLFVQRDQLPAIGADLANIAATLAETQRFSAMQIDTLNGQLHYIDALIGRALANDQDTSALEDNAITSTANVLKTVEGLRDHYSSELNRSLTELRREHGYDPAAIEDVDGDAELGQQQRGRSGTEHYEATQRAKDEELVAEPGPMTPEKAAAEARLRDFATATDPNATLDARQLAGERLDDFRMANYVGPLPTDPVLGGDARSRAQNRLRLQSQLEQGYAGIPPMTPDQATQTLDDGEAFGRVTTTKQAYFALTAAGVSEEGAKQYISGLIGGASPWLAGTEAYAGSIPQGKHALPVDLLSAADAKTIQKIAGRAGNIGNLVQLTMASYDWYQGGEGRNEDLGNAVGSVLGGAGAAWGAAAVAGSVTGPWTTAAIVVAASLIGGEAGGSLGGGVGSMFDVKPSAGGSW